MTVQRPSSGRSVLVSTVPFGAPDPRPLELLERHGIAYDLNPFGRPLREAELQELVEPYEVLVAGGSDPVSAAVLERAPRLRLVARTGIGLDSVDLLAARARGVLVTYTPDAPAPAVSELTLGHMLALLRHTPLADRDLRAGRWQRRVGRRLEELVVGIVGVGRIGRRVLGHLAGFGPPRVLLDDLEPDPALTHGQPRFVWADKETIWREADVVTLHLPLTPRTRGLIGERELALLRPGAVLINTSRGEIVDERALARALRARPDLGAALDVFASEPYRGELTELDNVVLSCHMGSCTADCRLAMELGAAEEVVRHLRGEAPACPVPDEEYALRLERAK